MLAYVHSGGGFSHLLSYVEHAAIWTAIRRFMYSLPMPVVIAIFVVACIGVVMHGKRRKVRTSNAGTTVTVTKDKDGNITGTKEVTRK